MAEDVQEGQVGAHTPRSSAASEPAAAPIEPGAALGAPSSGDLAAASALAGPSVEDLLAGSLDVDGSDLLSAAAELIAAPRRARGRPAGAGNRKNGDMIAYLQALGHRDPWVTLSMIQTADTASLAEQLGAPLILDGQARVGPDGKVIMVPADRAKVLLIQKQAAEALLPYHHAKKPQQLELPNAGGGRPVMVFGDLNVNVETDAAFWSIEGEKPNEINGEVVRDSGDTRTT